MSTIVILKFILSQKDTKQD